MSDQTLTTLFITVLFALLGVCIAPREFLPWFFKKNQ